MCASAVGCTKFRQVEERAISSEVPHKQSSKHTVRAESNEVDTGLTPLPGCRKGQLAPSLQKPFCQNRHTVPDAFAASQCRKRQLSPWRMGYNKQHHG